MQICQTATEKRNTKENPKRKNVESLKASRQTLTPVFGLDGSAGSGACVCCAELRWFVTKGPYSDALNFFPSYCLETTHIICKRCILD